jgi:hypothetical protein
MQSENVKTIITFERLLFRDFSNPQMKNLWSGMY